MDRFIAFCPLSLIFYTQVAKVFNFYQTKGVTFRSPMERDSIPPPCVFFLYFREVNRYALMREIT